MGQSFCNCIIKGDNIEYRMDSSQSNNYKNKESKNCNK